MFVHEFQGSNLPKETESVLKVYKEAVRCLIPAYSEKVVDLMPDLRTNNQSENEEPSRKRVKMMNDLNFPGPNEQLNNNNPVIEAAQTA